MSSCNDDYLVSRKILVYYVLKNMIISNLLSLIRLLSVNWFPLEENVSNFPFSLKQVTALDKENRSLRREGDPRDVPNLTSPPCSPRMTLYANNNQVFWKCTKLDTNTVLYLLLVCLTYKRQYVYYIMLESCWRLRQAFRVSKMFTIQ